jgi:hypothetical protein
MTREQELAVLQEKLAAAEATFGHRERAEAIKARIAVLNG